MLSAFKDFAAVQLVERLDKVKPLLVDRFRQARKPTHAAKSMCNDGTNLKAFFTWCVERDLLKVNPMAAMRFSKPKLHPRGGPDLAAIDTILSLAKEPQRTQMALLAFTGCRAGEMRRLLVADVDFDGNWIRIESRPGAETKSGCSRKVPIHPRLRLILESLSQSGRQWFFATAPTGQLTTTEQPIDPEKLNEYFKELLTEIGLPAGRDSGYTLHSLRSSFETICNHARIPQRVIDTWLGHGSDQSMAAVYYRLDDQESQKFIKKVPFGTGKPAADAG